MTTVKMTTTGELPLAEIFARPALKEIPDRDPVGADAHGPDCRCAGYRLGGMRCEFACDWLEGDSPTDTPPPYRVDQHDADALAGWARANRNSLWPGRRRRAWHAVRYAIHVREADLGWRHTSWVEWVWR